MNISLRLNIEATVEGVSAPVKSLPGAEEHFKAKLRLAEILQLNWSRYFKMSFKLQKWALKAPCRITLFG